MILAAYLRNIKIFANPGEDKTTKSLENLFFNFPTNTGLERLHPPEF